MLMTSALKDPTFYRCGKQTSVCAHKTKQMVNETEWIKRSDQRMGDLGMPFSQDDRQV